jgi:Ca2+-binding EF-hand superfamily protein
MGIAAIIGIVSSVIQAVRAFSPPETAQQPQQPQQKADRLFEALDAMGQGAIQPADLERAFDRISTTASAGADKLFAKLDADGDGSITRSEFTGSINRLADQLDQHFMRMRLHGEGGLPSAADAGFTKEELTGQISNIVGNFDKADANGDGRVSIREARAFVRGADGSPPSAADGQNVELMLQVVRLMQAYGVVGGSNTTADNGMSQRVSDRV